MRELLNKERLIRQFNSGFYVLLINVLEKAAFFLIFLLFARVFDLREYGKIITVFAFSNILNSVFEFGFPFYFQREAATNIGSAGQEMGTVISFKLVLYGVFLPIPILYFYFNVNADSLTVLILATAIYLFSIGSLLNSILFGLRDYRKAFHFLSMSRLCLLLTAVLFSFLKSGAGLILLSFVLAGLVHTIFLFRFLQRSELTKFKMNLDFGVLMKVLRSSLPIGAGILFVWIYDKVDILLIQRVISFEAVGLYSAAYSLYKISQVFCSIVLLPAYSVFSNRFSTKGFVKKSDLRDNGLALLLLAIIFILVFSLLSEILITTLYGQKFAEAAGLLSIICFAIPGLFLNNFTGIISNAIYQEKIPMFGTGIGVAANVLLISRCCRCWD
jgi:O-antigen/teichoic acid export membrane protein